MRINFPFASQPRPHSPVEGGYGNRTTTKAFLTMIKCPVSKIQEKTVLQLCREKGLETPPAFGDNYGFDTTLNMPKLKERHGSIILHCYCTVKFCTSSVLVVAALLVILLVATAVLVVVAVPLLYY